MDTDTGRAVPAVRRRRRPPSFLALHPRLPFLYAVNSVNDYEGRSSGAVSAGGRRGREAG